MSSRAPISLVLAAVIASSDLLPNCHAFQFSPHPAAGTISRHIREGGISRARSSVLVPQVAMPPPNEFISMGSYPSLSILYQNIGHDDTMEENRDEIIVDVTESSSTTDGFITQAEKQENINNVNNAIATFGSKLKNAMLPKQNLKDLQTFFLTLSILLLPLFVLSPESASAVQSGGRMGGSFGGSNRSSSSRSYSAPRSSGGYNRGYSGGYYSRPNVVVSPVITTPYYNPFYSPFSMGRPLYYGSPSGVVVSGGPSIFSGMFFVVGFFLLASFVMNTVGNDVGSSVLGSNVQSVLGSGVSVAEISVALQVPERDSPNSILSALSRLSSTSRTDSRMGLQNLTSQVALELLRRKQYIVSASTQGYHFKDESEAQRKFNNLSIQQRGKFETESVSKYGGVDYSPAKSNKPSSSYSSKATMAVVTIVLLIDGDSTSKQLSSKVNSVQDVENALSRIAADSKIDDCLRGAEILWTPEERDETLTMRDILADYPSLRSV